MNGHHLILGKLVDTITGETLNDTHDERYRQNIARFLIETKGYSKNDIMPRFDLLVKAGNNSALIKVDFLIELKNRIRMIIKYGPGSLVTRHRAAVSVSRLVAPYQIPVVIVTNGKDADILDGNTGKITGSGFRALPSKTELNQNTAHYLFGEITETKAEKESRIAYAFEVDGACPCDDTICKMPDKKIDD
jgi:hypothetical protein